MCGGRVFQHFLLWPTSVSWRGELVWNKILKVLLGSRCKVLTNQICCSFFMNDYWLRRKWWYCVRTRKQKRGRARRKEVENRTQTLAHTITLTHTIAGAQKDSLDILVYAIVCCLSLSERLTSSFFSSFTRCKKKHTPAVAQERDVVELSGKFFKFHRRSTVVEKFSDKKNLKILELRHTIIQWASEKKRKARNVWTLKIAQREVWWCV